MSKDDGGLVGRLPRSRPGTRSAKRDPAPGPRPPVRKPAAGASAPPAEPDLPLPVRAVVAAGQVAEAGLRAASRAAGGVLGRLPGR